MTFEKVYFKDDEEPVETLDDTYPDEGPQGDDDY